MKGSQTLPAPTPPMLPAPGSSARPCVRLVFFMEAALGGTQTTQLEGGKSYPRDEVTCPGLITYIDEDFDLQISRPSNAARHTQRHSGPHGQHKPRQPRRTLQRRCVSFLGSAPPLCLSHASRLESINHPHAEASRIALGSRPSDRATSTKGDDTACPAEGESRCGAMAQQNSLPLPTRTLV